MREITPNEVSKLYDCIRERTKSLRHSLPQDWKSAFMEKITVGKEYRNIILENG